MKTLRFGKLIAAALLSSILGALPFSQSATAQTPESASVLVVSGAGGQDEYAGTFSKWTDAWKKACALAGPETRLTLLGGDDKESRARLEKALATAPHESSAPLWLVLLGHGTFDGKEGKFNLAGNDLAAGELATWLKGFKRPVVIVCGFSSSGAFLKALAGQDRVIVTATRSGSEQNFARFGGYFADALCDPLADLDKDGQTSVLEAWLWASQKVAAFYKDEGRLATEHSLLEDNGDGLGTPPDWFKGVRVVKKAGAKSPGKADGQRAHQIQLIASADERQLSPQSRAERDALETEVNRLREAKATLPEEEFYGQLETVLRKLAAIYRAAGK